MLATACARFDVAPATPQRLDFAIASLELPSDAAVLVGAGDIAMCDQLEPAEATARLLAGIVAAYPQALVFTTGDHAYPDGTTAEFADCYEPTWGRVNARTRPTPGNHDYETPGAEPYYEYFRLFAERPEARGRGYYAFDHGAWRVVALNSIVPLRPGDEQTEWLAAELAAQPSACLLAFWHNPLFSSGFHGRWPWDNGRDTELFWRILMRHGVDLIVNGHDHVYERFRPQDADGRATPDGPRQITVGTGGAGLHRAFGTRRNSVYRNDDVFGVLVLALRPSSYEWAFVGVDGVVYDRSDAPVAC